MSFRSLLGPRSAGRGRWGLPPAPRRFVADAEVRRGDRLSALGVGPEQGVEGAAGQEGPLDRPGGLAAEHHLLDAVEQEREMGGGPGFLGPELGRLDLPVLLVTP